MNTLEAIKFRRSIRKYRTDIPVPREDIRQLLEAALMAPRACKTRPWDFVVSESREVKEQDCGAAVENILLAAKELGYGTCWCGCYPLANRVEAMQKILDVESVPLAVVAVGRADEEPAARGYLDESRVKYL